MDRKGPDAKLRVAVLDLGSTSFHLLVADASPTGTIERVVRRRVMLRLGATIADEGAIPKPIASTAVESARALRRVAEEHGAERLLPVATAALRDASNGAPLAESIARALGTPVRVLSGIEEARLIFAAFRHRIPLRDAVALGMDLGGGSLELAIGDGFEVQWETTLPLGVTRLHGELAQHDPLKRRERKQIEERVEESLAACRQGGARARPEASDRLGRDGPRTGAPGGGARRGPRDERGPARAPRGSLAAGRRPGAGDARRAPADARHEAQPRGPAARPAPSSSTR